MEQNNLIRKPGYQDKRKKMEERLYAMMEELGGMEIPLNAPRGSSQNKRLRTRDGVSAGDFPSDMVLEKAANKNAK